MIISAIRLVVNLKVSNSESDDVDDAVFFTSWFVLIDERLQNQNASKHRYGPSTHDKVSSINKYIDCLYVTTLTL